MKPGRHADVWLMKTNQALFDINVVSIRHGHLLKVLREMNQHVPCCTGQDHLAVAPAANSICASAASGLVVCVVSTAVATAAAVVLLPLLPPLLMMMQLLPCTQHL